MIFFGFALRPLIHGAKSLTLTVLNESLFLPLPAPVNTIVAVRPSLLIHFVGKHQKKVLGGTTSGLSFPNQELFLA